MRINEELLTAYVLGEVDSNEREQVELYIKENPSALQVIDEIRQSVSSVQSMFDSEDLKLGSNRLNQIFENEEMTESSPIQLFRQWQVTVPLLAAAAAVLFFVLSPQLQQKSYEVENPVLVDNPRQKNIGTSLVDSTGQRRTKGSNPLEFERTDLVKNTRVDWDSISVSAPGIAEPAKAALMTAESGIINCLRQYSTVQNFVVRITNGQNGPAPKVISVNGGFNQCVARSALADVSMPELDRIYDIQLRFKSVR